MSFIKNKDGVMCHHDPEWDNLSAQVRTLQAKSLQVLKDLDDPNNTVTKEQLLDAIKNAKIVTKQFNKIGKCLDRIDEGDNKIEQGKAAIRAKAEAFEAKWGYSPFSTNLERAFAGLPRLPTDEEGNIFVEHRDMRKIHTPELEDFPSIASFRARNKNK